MSDIVERLRGQEPLHLGDRLAAADEIDRLRATLERLREALESIAGGEIYPVQVALDALMADLGESK